MIYTSKEMEQAAILDAAQLMCTAARTAPKTKGIDNIETLVLTGDDLIVLADKLEQMDISKNKDNRTFLTRDANCLRKSGALVLIGIKKYFYGLNCGYCGFENCKACQDSGAACAFGEIDLGIAVGSAVKCAGDLNVDCRVMFSVGSAAREMNYADDVIWLGIPLSVSGKSPFFDRK